MFWSGAMSQTRRTAYWTTLIVLALGTTMRPTAGQPPEPVTKRSRVAIRGVYGGVPQQIFDRGQTLDDYGINAIWIGSGSVSRELVANLKARSKTLRIFVEFNTMHEAGYLKDHPDASPIGTDGRVSPPPDGWQGVCPTHPAYRTDRMEAFRNVLKAAPIDGIWLDYHHAQASWEQAQPSLPDTCFCERCLSRFQQDTRISLPTEPVAARARRILEMHKPAWVQWRCDVFTSWVREFREIIDRERPGTLLGTFHCPWSESDHDGAIREKLAIDLKAQSQYLDVLSIMPYHARFGHSADPAWISRQTAALGRSLGIKGEPGERIKSGRSCSFPTGARPFRSPRSTKSRPRLPSPGDRRDGVRLGNSSPAMG